MSRKAFKVVVIFIITITVVDIIHYSVHIIVYMIVIIFMYLCFPQFEWLTDTA